MNPQYLSINNKILELVKTPIDQPRIVALAMAIAVAAKAPLPSSVVDSEMAYYGNQVLPMAMETISNFGEGIVFASRSALDYTQTFWKLRYYSAHPAVMLSQLSYKMTNIISQPTIAAFDFSTLYSGGLTLISPELNTFLNQYKKEIMILAEHISSLLNEEQNNG